METLTLLASSVEISHDWPSLAEVLLYLAGIIFFLLLNAFFVASEFAIVKVRPSKIATIAENKPRRVGIAQKVLANLDGYLSANQLGITIASLALGFLGEPFVSKLVSPLLLRLPWLPEKTVYPISFFIAILSFTFLHVVIGELIPKSIAIRFATATTLLLARPLHLFYTIFRLPIVILNGAANFILKHIFRVKPISEFGHSHSAEELRILLEESEKGEEVTETEREILVNALALNDLTVKDIVTPRTEVATLDDEQSFDDNLRSAITATHTRFPLVKGHLDNCIGLVHVKDMLNYFDKEEKPRLGDIKRDLHPVPETMPLDVLLKFFLQHQAHMALVVDEFGGATGIVTFDNVVEELVGDIHDEFDTEDLEFHRISADEFRVDGGLGLYELTDHTDIQIENPEVSTIGGYITELLDHLPKKGEQVTIGDYLVTVSRTDGRSVGELHFRRNPVDEPESTNPEVEKSEEI